MKLPDNYLHPTHTVSPYLICAGALQAIEFYKQAFGATEVVKLVTPHGGLVHASLKIGDSMVMLSEQNEQYKSFGPLHYQGTPVVIHLLVPDVDATINQAVAAGAQLIMPPTDMFWGDRYGQVVDPFGHRWSVATPQKALTVEEMHEAMLQAMPQAKKCE